MTIVDAHHHLWDLDSLNIPWLRPGAGERFFGNPDPIRQNYLARDFARDHAGAANSSVAVEAGGPPEHALQEAVWLQQVIDNPGEPAALVARARLESRDLDKYLERVSDLPAFRGLRQIVGRSPAEDSETGTGQLLDDPDWRRGLGQLEKSGASFDLQLIPPQMDRLAAILGRHEDLPVALCHCGSPWQLANDRGEMNTIWREGIRKLAELPNVHCKISGLAMFSRPWRIERITEIIETILDSFGPNRCMWGSNFPVDKLHVEYSENLGRYQHALRSLAAAELARVFGETARQFYRLDQSGRENA